MKISKLFFGVLFLVGCSSFKVEELTSKIDSPDKKRKTFVVAWLKNLDPEYEAGNLPIGMATPLIHNEMVFMGNLSGEMSAYNLDNGRIIWQVNEKQAINAKASIFNDLVIYGSKEGRLFARNYFDGKLIYAIDLGAPIESSPIVHNGRMFIHLRDHRIVSLDASTGKVFWSYQRSVPYSTTLQRVSKVLPFENNIIVGFADGTLSALRMEEGVIEWEQRISSGVKFVDVDVEPIYFQGMIVAGAASGELKFINPKNGTIQRSIPLTIQSTPIKSRSTIYVGTVFGEIALVDESGKVLKRKKIADVGISSLAKWKGAIVATTMGQDILYLDPVSLEVKETYNLGHEQSAVFGAIEVKDNYMALYSSRNRLYIFK